MTQSDRLANRVLFKDRLSNAISYAARHHQHLATLFIDSGSLQNHQRYARPQPVGDMLLTHVAERLSESVRQSDSVSRHADHEPMYALARLGGDEFTILRRPLPQLKMRAGRPAHFGIVGAPVRHRGHEIFISASIGISIYPSDGSTVEALLKNADTAMYHAKEQGRNNCQFIHPGSTPRRPNAWTWKMNCVAP